MDAAVAQSVLRTMLSRETGCARATGPMTVEVGGDLQRSVDEAEDDQLDFRWGSKPTSRLLSEAIRSSQKFKIKIPKYTVKSRTREALNGSQSPASSICRVVCR